MIIIKRGNILDSKEDLIINQVHKNEAKLTKVAEDILYTYPILNSTYKDYSKLAKVGDTLIIKVEDGRVIANSFLGTKKRLFKKSVNYKDLEQSLVKIKQLGEKEKLDIALPYRIGCGKSKGDWGKVMDIITRVFGDYNNNVVVYKGLV
ncbi:hypothetical protein [uncultured Clostridium sp.]|uniref:hypothetical protein n=1 Tax=uncultured Clostridium sp. TaxID=59620 RepID=UPI0026F3A8D3|nr:hypothetical protein [uncultured Clostridium sp.]